VLRKRSHTTITDRERWEIRVGKGMENLGRLLRMQEDFQGSAEQ